MSLEMFLQHGKGTNGPFMTEAVEHKVSMLWWQEKGLSFTASGYGAKIPTAYMVKFYNRWHRVYCSIYSNVGSLYIVSKGAKIHVTEYYLS